MKRIATVAQMKAACRQITRSGKTLGFVPTMGALHEGHLSLIGASKSRCNVTAVSIFVNPLQFGPAEDLDKYPRTLERDAAMLEKLGVDLLFVPTVDEMYGTQVSVQTKDANPGHPAKTYVLVDELSDKLDGASRPGHFRGVATVVTKLFEIVRPDLAFFGQKDAVQVAVLRRMVRDLDMDVELVVCPIVREPDGLAMSSRNVYLSPEERRQALVLHRALMRVQTAADRGERDAEKLRQVGLGVIAEEPGARLDYLAIVNRETLDPVADVAGGALLAIAAYFGNTRLIDNIILAPR
jgi:pantoate--beta-alanine ligase